MKLPDRAPKAAAVTSEKIEPGSAAEISVIISSAEALVDRRRRLWRLLPSIAGRRPLLIRNEDRNSFDEQSEVLNVTDDEAATLCLASVNKVCIVLHYPVGMRRRDWTASTPYELELEDAGASPNQFDGDTHYPLTEAGLQANVIVWPDVQLAVITPQYEAIRNIIMRSGDSPIDQ